MNMIYFAKAFTEKADGSQVYGSRKYYRTTVNSLADVVRIYEHGYHFRLENKEDTTNFIVIDIDDCMDGTRNAVRKWIDDNNLQSKYYCNYSSSMSENKCKVLVWLDNEIVANKDNLMKATVEHLNVLKDALNSYFGSIEPDLHQVNNPTQLTYGLPRNEHFCNSNFNGLSINENDKVEYWKFNKENDVEADKIISPIVTIFEKENNNSHQIGITKPDIHRWIKNWYQNKYNKPLPVATKYTIIGKVYTPYMKATKDTMGNVINVSQYIVQDGHRHYVADKIIDIIAFNAFARAVFYNDIPSISDCMNRFNWLTSRIFALKDNKDTKVNWYTTVQEKYKNKCIKIFKSYLSNCDFNSYNGSSINDLLEYIAMNNNNMDATDIEWSYRPQDKELLRFTKDDEYMREAVHFAKYHSYEQLWDAIGPDCEGDVMIMVKLIDAIRRRLKKFDGIKLTKERSDKGKTHKEHKTHSNKGKCLANYTVVEEDDIKYVNIPKSDAVTNAMRIYCSKNKIKIVRV